MNTYKRFRDIKEILACRGIVVSYESIRQWCLKFAPTFAKSLKRKQGSLGDEWYLDGVFIKINRELWYLWRAVDRDGNEQLGQNFQDFALRPG